MTDPAIYGDENTDRIVFRGPVAPNAIHTAVQFGNGLGRIGASRQATTALLNKIERTAAAHGRDAALEAMPEVADLVLAERLDTTARIAAAIRATRIPGSGHFARIAETFGPTVPPTA